MDGKGRGGGGGRVGEREADACYLTLFFIIKNPKMQSLLMLKGFKLKKDQREFLCTKI